MHGVPDPPRSVQSAPIDRGSWDPAPSRGCRLAPTTGAQARPDNRRVYASNIASFAPASGLHERERMKLGVVLVVLSSACSVADHGVIDDNVTAPLSIATPSLPNAIVGTGYMQALSAAGGTRPYRWALVAGAPPDGLSLGSGGGLAGTVGSLRSSAFSVQVTDASGASASASFTIAVGVARFHHDCPPGQMLDDNYAICVDMAMQLGKLGGTVYWVAQTDPAATDASSAGTRVRPWKSIAPHLAQLQPGDAMIVRTGVYRESVQPPTSGVLGKRITFAAYTGDQVIITGADAVAGWTAAGSGHPFGTWKLPFDGTRLASSPVSIRKATWDARICVANS
jgi:Putative Ig domain